MDGARQALIFNVHAASVSTTSAQGKINTGVSSLIITAFGLDNRKVAWLSIPTIASVTAPSSAPATMIFQSNEEVTVEASTVIAAHRISE